MELLLEDTLIASLATQILSSIALTFWLLISSSDAHGATHEAKQRLRSSCQGAQRSASAAINARAEGASYTIEMSVNGILDTVRGAMVFLLVVLERIIESILGVSRSVLTAYIEPIISRSKAVASSFKKPKYSFNMAFEKILNSIRSALSGTRGYTPPPLQSKATTPESYVITLDGPMEKVQSPLQDGCANLNGRVIDTGGSTGRTNPTVDLAFAKLKSQVNRSFRRLRFTASSMPVVHEQEFEFCNTLDSDSVIDSLAQDIRIAKVRSAFLVASLLLAIILVGLLVWRAMQRRPPAEAGGVDNPSQDQAPPGIKTEIKSILFSTQISFSTSATRSIARLLHLSPLNCTYLHIFFACLCYPLGLSCLLAGLVGCLVVEIQLKALLELQRQYSSTMHNWMDRFSPNVTEKINAIILENSSMYTTLANARLEVLQVSVDKTIKKWADGTVALMNKVIPAYFRDLQNVVEKVFIGTFFGDSASSLVQQMSEGQPSKIENTALFVQQHFSIKVPRFSSGALSLDNAGIRRIVDPFVEDVVGADGKEGVVGQMMSRHMVVLQKQRVTFRSLLALGGAVCVMACWSSYGNRALAAWRTWRNRRGAR